MRAAILAILVGVAGCATQDVAQTSHAARFEGAPETFRAAFSRTCSAPSETLVRPARNTQECRILLPPNTTAGLIVHYDGIIEKLPYLVIRQSLTPIDARSVRVDIEHFVIVPHKSGPATKVLFTDPKATARIHDMIRRAGGEPLELPAQPSGDL